MEINFEYINANFKKEQKKEKKAKMKDDYEYRLKKKDDEVNELKKKIDDMSNEFAAMLRVISKNYYKDNAFFLIKFQGYSQ